MSEQKQELKIGKGELAIIVIGIFVSTAIGFWGGMGKASNDYRSISNNETYLYNLGYTQGYNEGIVQIPTQFSSEPTVSESELLSGIAEAFGKADKVAFWIQSDNETTKFHLDIQASKVSK